MKNYISIDINPSPITGFPRKVSLSQLMHIDFDNKTGEIYWKVWQVDEEGEVINNPDLNQGRIVSTPINNSNKVTQGGVMITREYVESQNAQEKEETDEEYNQRISELMESELENGIPEFEFWLGLLTSQKFPIALTQAAQLLASFGRFDRT